MLCTNTTFCKTYCFVVNKIAFIYLTGFSKIGGIEKFNKNVLASFKELNTNADAYSVYDTNAMKNIFIQIILKDSAVTKYYLFFQLS